MRNTMKLDLPCTSSSDVLAKITIIAFMSQLHLSAEQVADVKSALSEAISNCIFHAYPEGGGRIYITSTLNGRELTVTIRDKGVGIADIDKAKMPLYTTRSPELSGMGFTVMESFMDNVKVSSVPGKGTTVTLRKILWSKNY